MPDGKRVAYWLRAPHPPAGQPDCAIALRDLDRGTDTVLVDCQQRPQPVFDLSADGTSLIYAALPLRRLSAGTDAPPTLLPAFTEQLTAPAPGDGTTYPRIQPGRQDRRLLSRHTVACGCGRSALTPSAPRMRDQVRPPGELPSPAGVGAGRPLGVAWLPRGGGLVAAADWLGFRALNRLADR